MIRVLASLATHTLALVVYPGLFTVIALGGVVEAAWTAFTRGRWALAGLPRGRPTTVIVTIGLCSMLAAVQLAAPFNPVPSEERNLVVAAVALAFTVWAELALTVEVIPEPRLLLVIQFCWLLAVLGPAVQPESLRPQVLGNVLVPGLLPVKIACAFLYMLCLPALLGLWPMPPPADRRAQKRLNVARGLRWFPYCGLFTTLFFPPSGDDAIGFIRFFGISFLIAVIVLVSGLLMERRGTDIARGLYARAVPPYAALVLAVVVVTAALFR
jgi:hypothetical protein